MPEPIPTPSPETPPAAPPAPKMPAWKSQVSKGFAEKNAAFLEANADRSIEDVLSEHLSLSKTVQERGIIIPTEKSTPEERKAFHDRMGLPTKPEEYELAADGVSKEELDALRAHYWKNGFTKNQAKNDLAARLEGRKAAQTAQQAAVKAAEDGYMAALVKENGGDEKAAEEDLNLAKKYIQTTFSQEVREELVNSGRIYNAKFLRDMAKAQRDLEPKRRLDGNRGPLPVKIDESAKSRSRFGTGEQFDSTYGAAAGGK